MYEEAMKGVKHLLVKKSKPNGLVFVGELPGGVDGGFSPKMDHLVSFIYCLILWCSFIIGIVSNKVCYSFLMSYKNVILEICLTKYIKSNNLNISGLLLAWDSCTWSH